MRTGQSFLIAGFVLAGIAATMTANADVPWAGAGWYVEGSASGMDITLIAGPYSNEADCKSHQPPNEATYFYACSYETSDPTDDGGARDSRRK